MTAIRVARVNWREGADPIDWLPQSSALRRVAYMPIITPRTAAWAYPSGDFKDMVVLGAEYEHYAEASLWIRFLLGSVALPFDETPRELMTSRASFFFGRSRPRRKPAAAGVLKWSGPLTLKRAWQDLPPLYLSALEDLARLVVFWLRQNEAAQGHWR